jgi:phosphatidylglycerol:prolipoprotein diacylglycerol transferase
VLFSWRGVRVHSYTAMLYLGLLAGTYTTYAAARVLGLRRETVPLAILLLLVPAVVGARLAFVVGRWRVLPRAARRVFRCGEGGAVSYGALLTVPLSALLLAALHIPFASFWDAGALGFVTASIFLKFGCLLNGCCCGRVTSGRLSLVQRNVAGVRERRIPNQLLEAGWAAALLVAATFVLGRMPFSGALFLSLLAAYAVGRFALDFTREGARIVGPLTMTQCFSAGFVLFSLGVLAIGFGG